MKYKAWPLPKAIITKPRIAPGIPITTGNACWRSNEPPLRVGGIFSPAREVIDTGLFEVAAVIVGRLSEMAACHAPRAFTSTPASFSSGRRELMNQAEVPNFKLRKLVALT
jgi:hypothetical protein